MVAWFAKAPNSSTMHALLQLRAIRQRLPICVNNVYEEEHVFEGSAYTLPFVYTTNPSQDTYKEAEKPCRISHGHTK